MPRLGSLWACSALALVATSCTALLGIQRDIVIEIDSAIELGATEPDLVGFNFQKGGADVCELEPGFMRLDADLGQIAPAPGVLELDDLLDKIRTASVDCGEPLVILSYMPEWLAGPGPDPSIAPPADYDAWQELVTDVVTALATAPHPATWFEVWNEPDIPIFWGGSLAAFSELAVRTHRAVAQVELATGLDLRIGGPGAALSATDVSAAYLRAVADAGLTVDFLSWHSYPNLLLGPDGEEFTSNPLSNLAYPLISGINPFMSPEDHRRQIRHQRQVASAILGSDAATSLMLGITEWNMSSGGYDVRNDTSDAAAFAAASLTVFEEEGLDLSAFFRSGSSGRAGDWGVVAPDGTRAPKWGAFQAFAASQGTRVAIRGSRPEHGLYARATKGANRADVVISTYASAPQFRVHRRVTLTGLPAGVRTARLLAPGSSGFTPVDTGSSESPAVDVPAQSVLWVTVDTSPVDG